MSAEKWKPLPGWPGYTVSDHGRVCGPRKMLTGFKDKNGYLRVNVSKGPKRKMLGIHTCVLYAHVSVRPEKLVCNHIDGNKLNNHVSNLEWVTQAENIHHAFDTGLNCNHTETHHGAKLTNEQVMEIVAYSPKNLAKKYGLSVEHIRMIQNNTKWQRLLLERES